MHNTLIKMEFRRNYKGMLIWAGSVALMIYLVIILYPMVKDMYAELPPEMQTIMASFGGIPTNILEYYATEGAMMLQLFGGIFAALLGFNMIANIEKEKVAETFYVLPIAKSKIYFNKWLMLTVLVTLFSLINYGLGFIGFWSVKETIDVALYSKFSLYNTVMYLYVAYLGFSLAIMLKNDAKNMVAIIIPLPLYIFTVISSLTDNEWLSKLKYLSPFTFADPVAILKDGAKFEWVSFLVYSGIILLTLTTSYFLFKKRVSVK